MKALLVIRENLQKIYAHYGNYINKIGKFLLALITFFMINKNLGYMEVLTNSLIVLVLAVVCMFLPLNFTVFFAGVMILVHLYKLSLEALLICGLILLILFLVYMRVVPKQAVIVLLVPITFLLKMPFVMPIALGLVCTPLAMVGSACGIFVYYMLQTITAFGTAVLSTSGEENAAMDMVAKASSMASAVIINKEMYVYMIVFAAVILVVYLIRRTGFPFCWLVSIVLGLILQFAGVTILGGRFGVSVNGPELVMGSIVSLVVALILHLFFFTVDYSATKKVQFEDDEYVYYVKAIPKLRVSTTTRRVKRIREDEDLDAEAADMAELAYAESVAERAEAQSSMAAEDETYAGASEDDYEAAYDEYDDAAYDADDLYAEDAYDDYDAADEASYYDEGDFAGYYEADDFAEDELREDDQR